MKAKSLLAAAVCLFVLASCGNSGNTAETRAQQLLEQARTALDANNLEQARSLLDTLDAACKEAVDVRREAMPLRARLMESEAIAGIPAADEQIARCMMQIDQLGAKMAEGDDAIDPFVVPKAWPARGDIKAEGIEPRVSRKGFFRLIVKTTGKPLDLNAVKFTIDGQTAVAGPLAAERVAKLEGSEMLSLSQEEFQSVAELLEANEGKTPLVELSGNKGSRAIKFSEAQTTLLLDAWHYSSACQQLFEAQKERERLERQLKIARDQSARLSH